MKKILITILLLCLAFTAAGCSCRINIITDADKPADNSSEIEDLDDEDMDESGESEGAGGSTENQGDGNNTNNNNGQQIETISPPTISTISFPYEIAGTGLIIQQVSSYSGYFIEDASDREVSGIAAIVLTNNGGDLSFVGIGISQGERSLAFTGSQIPAHSTVIIQEQSAAAYSASDPYYSATATTQPAEFNMSEDLISVKDNSNGTFSVINLSDETFAEVKVYFKYYLPEEDVYVGGITYTVTLENVEPESEVEVTSSHYDVNYSIFAGIDVKQ